MVKNLHFYAVIIGTEILNGRRQDSHFGFLKEELLRRNWEFAASLTIADKPELIEKIFALVKSDPQSVMFCFGGIGATPDDYTRVAAASVFRNKAMQIHEEAKKLIIERFKEEAYPYRIQMANLPVGAGLLHNPITNVPGFYLDERFFFTPGFPQMAHPMVREALDRFYPNNITKTRLTLTAYCGENAIIDIMQKLPDSIEFSSLPAITPSGLHVVISLASYDEAKVQEWFAFFQKELIKKGISFVLGDKTLSSSCP